jgi:FMN-dependent NADH-azoreductase
VVWPGVTFRYAGNSVEGLLKGKKIYPQRRTSRARVRRASPHFDELHARTENEREPRHLR